MGIEVLYLNSSRTVQHISSQANCLQRVSLAAQPGPELEKKPVCSSGKSTFSSQASNFLCSLARARAQVCHPPMKFFIKISKQRVSFRHMGDHMLRWSLMKITNHSVQLVLLIAWRMFTVQKRLPSAWSNLPLSNFFQWLKIALLGWKTPCLFLKNSTFARIFQFPCIKPNSTSRYQNCRNCMWKVFVSFYSINKALASILMDKSSSIFVANLFHKT